MKHNKFLEEAHAYVGKGWWPIIDKYLPEIMEIAPDCNIIVKEKFGALRIGAVGKTTNQEKLLELKQKAENESLTICEVCGAPGKHRSDLDWMQTLCEACYQKTLEEEWQRWYDAGESVEEKADILFALKTAQSVVQINDFKEEIAQLLPAVRVMFDYDQQNAYHQYDLWEHCVHTVINLPRNANDEMLYWAALLHDIGKPACQCDGKREDDTNKHYYGHPQKSMEIVRDEIWPILRSKNKQFSEDDKRRLFYYVEYHDDRVSVRPKHLKRHLKIASFEEFQNLMRLQIADAKAHVLLPIIEERIHICEQWVGEYGREVYQRLKGNKE